MNFYIYKTTNLLNFKIYIGRHTGIFDPKYLGSGKWIKLSVKKYGFGNFRVEELIMIDNMEEANELEKYYIKLFEARNPEIGYNIAEGGEGLTSNSSRELQHKLIENGTHPFLNSEAQQELARKRVKNGTHPFLDVEPTRLRVKNGTHPCVKSWTCPHCGKEGKSLGNFSQWHGDNCKSLQNMIT